MVEREQQRHREADPVRDVRVRPHQRQRGQRPQPAPVAGAPALEQQELHAHEHRDQRLGPHLRALAVDDRAQEECEPGRQAPRSEPARGERQHRERAERGEPAPNLKPPRPVRGIEGPHERTEQPARQDLALAETRPGPLVRHRHRVALPDRAAHAQVLPQVGIGEPVRDQQCQRPREHREHQPRRRVRERDGCGHAVRAGLPDRLHSPSYLE